MPLIQVTVSGAVGKQVINTSGAKAILDSVTLSPSGANANITIRDGNASGEVVFAARVPSAYGSKTFPIGDDVGHKFTKGMHVKVIGTNASAYLFIG